MAGRRFHFGRIGLNPITVMIVMNILHLIAVSVLVGVEIY